METHAAASGTGPLRSGEDFPRSGEFAIPAGTEVDRAVSPPFLFRPGSAPRMRDGRSVRRPITMTSASARQRRWRRGMVLRPWACGSLPTEHGG